MIAVKRPDIHSFSIIDVAKLMYSVSLVSESVIAFILVCLLRGLRVGFKTSDTVIDKLVLYTISTGGATALVALGGTITTTILPNTPDNLIFGLLQTKSQ